MARPRLERGDHGAIGTKQVDGRWRGWVRFRDESGAVRMIERWAPTKAKAETAVRAALRERDDHGVSTGSLQRTSTVAAAWEVYVAEVLPARASSTRRVYRIAWSKHLEPAVGKLAVSEVTELDVERVIRKVAEDSGAGAAKTARTVLLGVLDQARKARAIKVNPVVGSERPAEKVAKKRESLRDKDRALSADEREELLALTGDAADLIAFMIGTGVRIGEACAVQWDAIDLVAGTARIEANVRPGRERVEETKTTAGIRTVSMPSWLVDRLTARRVDSAEELVFPAPLAGGVRDLRATDREIRRVLDGHGFTWATCHTFRRTVATKLVASSDPVQAAAFLGHANPSLTLDRYGKRDAAAQDKLGALL